VTNSIDFRKYHLGILACIFGLFAFSDTPSCAALGDKAVIPAGATVSTLVGATAQVISFTDTNGIKFKEYVEIRTGEIFAYSWAGPAQPNLGEILGSHTTAWRSAASSIGELRNARVNGAGVVVETAGHMRSYVGRAWLPASLPAGVSEGDLQ
jgi:hypothetical protein